MVLRLGEPPRVHPKVRLSGEFDLVTWAPPTADDSSPSTDWKRVAVFNVGLFHILRLSI